MNFNYDSRNKIVIVSNRLPVTIKISDSGKVIYSHSSGGLVTGLGDMLKNKNIKWVGWPGIADDNLVEGQKNEIIKTLKKHNMYPVFLSQYEIDGYYNGFSNSVLWPTMHGMGMFEQNKNKIKIFWREYKKVNIKFAGIIKELCSVHDKILVNDYHLFLLPSFLKKESYFVTFFLHIPFPKPNKFSKMPFFRSIIIGVGEANLIGCHVNDYCKNLINTYKKCSNQLTDIQGRVVSIPMGIDYKKYQNLIMTKKLAIKVNSIRTKFNGVKIILSVDRLDPTKQILRKVVVLKKILSDNHNLIRHIVLVIIAVPTREYSKEYVAYRIKLENEINIVNDLFGTDTWKPIDYRYENLNRVNLIALYRASNIMLVTPIADGMNLVAKEYVAAQNGLNGVLILSKTAGAAKQLNHAILIDSKSENSIKNAILKAMNMNKMIASMKIKRMQKDLAKRDIDWWRKEIIHRVAASNKHICTN